VPLRIGRGVTVTSDQDCGRRPGAVSVREHGGAEEDQPIFGLVDITALSPGAVPFWVRGRSAWLP